MSHVLGSLLHSLVPRLEPMEEVVADLDAIGMPGIASGVRILVILHRLRRSQRCHSEIHRAPAVWSSRRRNCCLGISA
jgi:hypothetical protein